MKPYSLSLYTSVLDPAQTFVAALTNNALGWRRSARAIWGDWAGQFTRNGDPTDLQAAFDSWLGYHLVERVGGAVTWTGLINELELSAYGTTLLRSLDLVSNATRTHYTIPAGPAYTTWSTSAQSIARYGRHEKTLILRAPLASAEIVRDKALATNAWPWPHPTGSLAPTKGSAYSPAAATLTVRVIGYAQTANWMIATVGDGLDHNLSDWIAALIGAGFGLIAAHGGAHPTAGDCQLLTIGTIQGNTLQITQDLTTDMRTGDLIRRLVALGDTTSRPWQLHVDAERRVYYRAANLTPRYYLRRGAVYDSLSSPHPVTPWLVRPAVIRDMANPVRHTEPGSFLTDARDAYVDEVEAYGDGRLVLKTNLFDETDLLAAQLDYLYP